VVQRLEDERIVYLTISEVVEVPRQSRANIILWVDDKLKEGQEMFKQIRRQANSIYLYQLISTEELSKWIASNKALAGDKSSNIIVITNMRRIEAGK
jgi:hypothetical protein